MPVDLETSLRSPNAYALAQAALKAMEANKVWPTALNFELWLHYVAAKDSPIGQEIDGLIAKGESFTDGLGEQLAARHLPKAKLNEQILEAGGALSKELDQVSHAIRTAQESSEAYGAQLASATEALDADDNASIKAMVVNLADATQRVQSENQAPESRLADTTAEVSRLREHLEQVRRDAMTDGLTNLANRKAFDEELEAAITHAEATGEPLVLAMLDIDHFKKFNDTWGHQTGDQVLRYVASVIDRVSSKPRIAARYGGEEFAIIFPGEQSRAALAALEEIREEVSTRVLKRRSTNEDLGALTMSAGLALFKPGEPATMLVERADEALYTSKRTGRNRTTSADPIAMTAAA